MYKVCVTYLTPFKNGDSHISAVHAVVVAEMAGSSRRPVRFVEWYGLACSKGCSRLQ